MSCRVLANVAVIASSLFAAFASFAAENEKPAAPALPPEWVKTFEWRCIGPANMGGRITALAVYEKDPSTWWVATASGGLLKTTNNGITFEHQFDRESTVSIGDVAVAQSDAKIVWVGTGECNPRNSVGWGDGVYKSVDGGKTWNNMGLKNSFQIGAIAIHPTNPEIVYVAAAGRLWGPNEERGLFKSTDAGKTWAKILYIDEKTGVIDVQMSPADPDTLLAATYERQRDATDANEPATRWGPGSGLYKSTDGGESWRKLTEGLPSSNMGRIGIDYYRKEPNTVYVVLECEKMGQEPENAPYAGLRGEDADVGSRLTEVTKEGPSEAAGLKVGDIVVKVDDCTIHSYDELVKCIRKHLAGEAAKFEVSRERKSVLVDVTFAPRPTAGTPNGRARTPFSSMLNGQRENIHEQQGPNGHEYGGIYKSTDGGESWTRINSVNPRPMYFSEVRVDPSDNQNLYVLGVSLYRSKDGGATFTGDGGRGAHPDHHAMWIDPNDGRHMILGNDGGLYASYDRGDTWDHLNHMAIGQFYHVAVDPRPNYMVYGGLQDNGSWGGPTRARYDSGPANHDWISIGGGDGFVCQVDYSDPDQVYFESQNGGMGRFNLRTGERDFIRPSGQGGGRYRWNWKTPFILSNHNPRIFYAAGNYVFRSLDRGRSLKAISPEITRTKKGTASALAESPRDSDVLYVGTDDGALWVTRNGGHEWNKILDFPDDSKPEKKPDTEIVARPAAPHEESHSAADGAQGAEVRTPAARPGPARGEADAGGPRGARMFSPERLMQFDKNGDGKLQKDELPERMQRLFDRADLNHDGELDADELKAMAERMRAGPPGGRRRGGDPDAEPPPPEIETPPSEGNPPPAVLNDGGGPLTDDHHASDKTEPTGGMPSRESEQSEPSRVGMSSDAPESSPSPPPAPDMPASAPPAAEAPSAAPSEGKDESPAPAAQEDPVSGHWTAEVLGEDMPEERREISFLLKLEMDGKVSGSMKSFRNSGNISEGRFDAKTGALTFSFDAGRFPLSVTSTIREGRITGEADAGEGTFTFEFQGRRTKMLAEGESVLAPASREPKEEVDPDARPLQEQLPGPRWVSSIEPSRYADGRVYLTLDAHRSNDDEPYLFVSQNYGKTWRSIRANLPASAGSTRVIREDIKNENVLYLGTEFGIWVSIDRAKSWTTLNNNLPTVAVHEIAQHPTTGEIVAATHGRSLWVVDISPLRQMTRDAIAAKAQLYKPTAAIYWRPDPSRGSEGARRYVGQNPPSGAQLYYSLGDEADAVTLKITGPTGETIRDIPAPNEAGLHRLTWDLRRTPNERPPRRPRGEAGNARNEAERVVRESDVTEGPPPDAARVRRGGGDAGAPAVAERAGQQRPGRGGFARRGQLVEPGKYAVALSVDGQTIMQTVAVETDPEHPDYRAWEQEDRDEQFGDPDEDEDQEIESSEGPDL